MSFPASDLLDLLRLERIEHNIYRGQNRDVGTGRIYGGQVLAQALVAAQNTVEADRPIHSMHGYFILAGDLSVPVVYFVDRLRDGGSFTTRRVTAIQHGRAIFNLSASFHRPEPGLEHQVERPAAPDPDSLRPELELIREGAHALPDDIRPLVTQDRPLDIRPIDETDPYDRKVRPPRRRYWVRAAGPLGDDPLHHHAVLAYASDYGLIVSALRPHGKSFRDPDMMVASLDHSIWFHRPFRADEWLLYDVESPVSCGGRGFARGTYFTREGQVVASVAQEGLLRVRSR
ncbi:MAG TPA: acyl-CoA thioesterase II [Longimicrobiales bacterium]|nr:acyl-CoA thioesterase II [Longimicrobiales bacterium]